EAPPARRLNGLRRCFETRWSRPGGLAMKDAEREPAKRLPLFEGLPASCVDYLLETATVRRVVPGTILFREGDPAEHVHIVMSGIIEISQMQGRRDCGVLMFTGGDIFMTAAALFDEPYLTSARALTLSRLLVLEGARLRREACTSSPLAMRICQLMAGQWRMAVRHILDLKCRSAPERLAAFLLRLVDDSPFSD